MATAVQLRRGTTTQNNAFTGALGEVSVDTTLDTVRVHDGSTQGGFEITSNAAAQTLTNKTLTAPTLTGTAVMATLDISGDVDVDGTLEADTITVAGVALATFVRDTVGTNMFSSNTETGITVTYDTSNDNVDLVLNAAQTGINSILATDLIIGEDAQTAIDFGTADEIDFKAANAVRLTLAAGALRPQTNNQIDLGTASLEFKDAFFDGTVTSDAFAGPLTGNASTATALATARTIAGVSFDGSANIAIAPTDLTSVTASAADINLIDGITNGTVIASKAIITDANKDITGGRNVTISGELDAATLDISGAIDVAGNSVLASVDVTGVATALTFEPDGDTAAGDNAAIGYTAALGLILTGQGSTNDVTIVNDADATVMGVATGTVNVTFAGTVGSGAITSTGIVTGTGFTAGSAVLAEAELELLDGLTAGTAIASKVVTTDANIDTSGQRNLTITGELDAATGDFSGAVDIAGDLTLSAGADGALTFGTSSSIKMVDNSATSLVIEEADTAYMTFNTANSSGEFVEMGKPLDLNGNNLILDADADTYIDGGTADDTLDIYLAGAKDFTFTANTFTAASGSSIVATAGDIKATDGVVSGKREIISTFNTSSAVTGSLTRAQSGGILLIDGTENNVINLPAANTANVGTFYDYIVLTAAASDKTTIFNIAGSGGNFFGTLSLSGGTAANAVIDNAGDALTLVNSTVVGSRGRITCLVDNGTNGTWQVESVGSPIATIA